MSAPEGNSLFCFHKSIGVSRDEVEGNIEIRGKTKLTISQGNRHQVFCYIATNKNQHSTTFIQQLCFMTKTV
jgi:hypothetical protein